MAACLIVIITSFIGPEANCVEPAASNFDSSCSKSLRQRLSQIFKANLLKCASDCS